MKITKSTRGKLIIIGEFSVLYGLPVFSTPIDKKLKVTLDLIEKSLSVAKKNHEKFDFFIYSNQIKFEKNNKELFEYHRNSNSKDLKSNAIGFKLNKIKEEIKLQNKFLTKNTNKTLNYVEKIKNINLPEYTVAFFLNRFNLDISNYILFFKIESQIPIGSGMGSSAALISSLIYVLNEFFYKISKIKKLSEVELYELAREIECYQHGFSSGIDILTVNQNFLIKKESNKIVKIDADLNKLPFYVVQTGSPNFSTGDSVKKAKNIIDKNPEILLDFSYEISDFEFAICKYDHIAIKKYIKLAHRFLVKIGVVPVKLQELIGKIEDLNGAAKVSGAGSIDEDLNTTKAGALLIFFEDEEEKLLNLLREYNLICEKLKTREDVCLIN